MNVQGDIFSYEGGAHWSSRHSLSSEKVQPEGIGVLVQNHCHCLLKQVKCFIFNHLLGRAKFLCH